MGDVITFEDPAQDGHYLVKRVVGVAGDRIEIRSGVLFRNGKAVSEPYIDTKIEDGDFGPVTVKPGTVFVLGDNRHDMPAGTAVTTASAWSLLIASTARWNGSSGGPP